jgi:hypothetical protein
MKQLQASSQYYEFQGKNEKLINYYNDSKIKENDIIASNDEQFSNHIPKFISSNLEKISGRKNYS